MALTDRLDQIQARANAATPGRWHIETEYPEDGVGGEYPVALHGPDTSHVWVHYPNMVEQYGHQATEIGELTLNDAEFIAAAREDVPALVNFASGVLAATSEFRRDPTWDLATAIELAAARYLGGAL